MATITIITIVVVALLTVAIFILAWLGYESCLRMYRMEIAQGKHDVEILKEHNLEKGWGLVGIIIFYLVLLLLIIFFAVGIFHKVNGEEITINNKTILVIKSNSMSDFYDDTYASSLDYDNDLHFSLGDICLFEKVRENDQLVKGEVYGYKYKNMIITHRLVSISDEGICEFRGDNNSISDVYKLKQEDVIYHYTGIKIQGLGAFILYAQSYFGIWSIAGITGITISSEIVFRKIDRMNKKRYSEIVGEKE